ncbi:hypothetical protein [Lyngbya sp. CCY1209]|jgi:hypothetical protein|uniref:hypothetical protein n=1 Tax=Lyngbya sp. CCY1209 TaxID=2886103 RepID=UPI002D215B0E|nr:hypothetical protein [Lyngbya sp. CCY1209]MEB3885262.1 hypothetical protein [Lyngbya sp. CCY1209]
MTISEFRENWRQAFVETNLLIIGYNAWVGYLAGEQGAVVCSLNHPRLGMTGETFRANYVPRSRMAPFLNAWLVVPDTAILQHHHINSHILQAIDVYNPETDAILLLESGQMVTFLYLRNLPIAPPKGYEMVCKCWEEFYISDADLSQMKIFQIDLIC